MGNYHKVDKGELFIQEGMTLITDTKSDKYLNKPKNSYNELREVVGDHVHDLERQTMLHEQIRNDDDYDDWEYGTEPSYGKRV